MAIENLGPLDWRIPIVTPEGRPTSEFQRRWKLQVENNGQIGEPADPTAIASDVAVIGTANTFMRSDSAPEIQKATDSQFGVVQVDGTTITETGGIISASGGGGGAWTMVNQSGAPITSGNTWAFSSNVTNVDVINLDSYNDVMVIVRNVTTNVSDHRLIRVSVDNGSSFYSSSGDYVEMAIGGLETNVTALLLHNTAGTNARGFYGIIYGIQLPGPRYGDSTNGQRLFVASTLPINAIRLTTPAGTTNLTGGTMNVYVR